MSELKRIPVKYVRDYIKKHYSYGKSCYICKSTSNLELHHLYSISELWNNWVDKRNLNITEYEEIKELRVEFYEEHLDLLSSENLYTLCKAHHEKLHSIYGQRYSNWRSEKVKNWIEAQKNKFGETN
jgi:hypothetical protein